MKFIGATETYDPCFVPDWDNRLLEVNIIISKELTDEMITKLVSNKDKIIFHHTVTGHGGTEIEPGVKSPEFEFNQFKKLINAGFPLSQYVLRVDPIIPYTPELMVRSIKVFEMYHTWAIENNSNLLVRISLIDCYSHVRKEFERIGIKVPWDTFHCPLEIFKHVNELLCRYRDRIEFDACCESKFIFKESVVHPIPCASEIDVIHLKYGDKPSMFNFPEVSREYDLPKKPQRPTCHCLAKKQILGVKPGRCPHKCIYCYWKE